MFNYVKIQQDFIKTYFKDEYKTFYYGDYEYKNVEYLVFIDNSYSLKFIPRKCFILELTERFNHSQKLIESIIKNIENETIFLYYKGINDKDQLVFFDTSSNEYFFNKDLFNYLDKKHISDYTFKYSKNLIAVYYDNELLQIQLEIKRKE